jgi:hypothetical protein
MIELGHADNSYNAAALLALLLNAGLVAPGWDTKTILTFTDAYRAKRNRKLTSAQAVAELLEDRDGDPIPIPLLSEMTEADEIAY